MTSVRISLIIITLSTLGVGQTLSAYGNNQKLKAASNVLVDDDFGAEEMSIEKARKIIFHGNYCGLGMRLPPTPGMLFYPLDLVDSLCLQHDYCYDSVGRGHCLCDEAIADQSRLLLKNEELTFKQKLVGKAIIRLFGRNHCDR